ncbi:MAG: LruC domain-containing protein [Bacteroidetes bacterium]|nr:LruC domain-containing protein [Bacteroidota bacterium]
MKITKFVLVAAVMFSLFSLQSCQKDTNKPAENDIEKLVIPDGFLFETTRDIQLRIVLPTSIDFTDLRGRVNVFTNLPAEGGSLLTSASADEQGIVDVLVRVPSYLTELYIETLAGSIFYSLPIQGTKEGGIVIDFNEPIGFDPPNVIPDLKQQPIPTTVSNDARLHEHANTVVNLVQNGEFTVDDFGLIADWPSPMVADGKWYVTSTLGLNHAQRFSQSGEYMMRITPSSARYGGVAQLVTASGGQLITLSANVRGNGNSSNNSWLFLIPRNASGNSIGFYSIQYRPQNAWATKTIAATMPAGTASVQVLLWSHIYGGTIDYDKVVVTGPVTDADGDGVDDDLDEYPNDAARAFNIYYPGAGAYGTLAYEDLWPGKGDYDFNDLVIDYQYKQVLNAANKLVECRIKYSVRAIGASLENGFGIEFPGTVATDIDQISGNHISENYLSFNANGTEAGQTKAVVIAFDNAFDMLSNPGGGFGINTNPLAPYSTPDTLELYVHFGNPVLFQNTGTAPFNPFIIVNKERGREVHLPGKTPTSLASPSLFGTDFDATNPSTNKYYQSATNLPWAVNLPVHFDYPVEKVQIVNAYLKFGNWAESSGVQFPDWYLSKAGYRTSSNVYVPAN